jgi:hypothetical protein
VRCLGQPCILCAYLRPVFYLLNDDCAAAEVYPSVVASYIGPLRGPPECSWKYFTSCSVCVHGRMLWQLERLVSVLAPVCTCFRIAPTKACSLVCACACPPSCWQRAHRPLAKRSQLRPVCEMSNDTLVCLHGALGALCAACLHSPPLHCTACMPRHIRSLCCAVLWLELLTASTTNVLHAPNACLCVVCGACARGQYLMSCVPSVGTAYQRGLQYSSLLAAFCGRYFPGAVRCTQPACLYDQPSRRRCEPISGGSCWGARKQV